MLYELPAWAEVVGALNVFRYITFRSMGAVATALLITLWLTPCAITWLRLRQGVGTPVREEMLPSHAVKQATPTMGGVVVLAGVIVSSLLWADLTNGYLWIVLAVTVAFGLIGVLDDHLKLTRESRNGLSAKTKLLIQSALAITAVMVTPLSSTLAVPFFKDVALELGWFFIPFAAVVVVGASNAVNLTDGLDGLAIVPVMLVAACFAVIAYLCGHIVFADYLYVPYIPGSGELTVLCGSVIGAGLGFLWYNAPPARVFMGDTGSLAMGAAIGMIAVITKHELVLVIVGGVFVIEALSVIAQVICYKLTGSRIFLMAPIHHHFERKGWAEPTIVIRFWIIAVVLALIGMASLKLR